jgi:hypothetical protein
MLTSMSHHHAMHTGFKNALVAQRGFRQDATEEHLQRNWQPFVGSLTCSLPQVRAVKPLKAPHWSQFKSAHSLTHPQSPSTLSDPQLFTAPYIPTADLSRIFTFSTAPAHSYIPHTHIATYPQTTTPTPPTPHNTRGYWSIASRHVCPTRAEQIVVTRCVTEEVGETDRAQLAELRRLACSGSLARRPSWFSTVVCVRATQTASPAPLKPRHPNHSNRVTQTTQTASPKPLQPRHPNQ